MIKLAETTEKALYVTVNKGLILSEKITIESQQYQQWFKFM